MNAKINDGGPAFPVPDVIDHDRNYYQYGGQGMTLRDYFAAEEVIVEGEMTAALAEALMSSDIPKSDGSNIQIIALYRWWAEAESRYKFMRADAMLAAREVQP